MQNALPKMRTHDIHNDDQMQYTGAQCEKEIHVANIPCQMLPVMRDDRKNRVDHTHDERSRSSQSRIYKESLVRSEINNIPLSRVGMVNSRMVIYIPMSATESSGFSAQ